MSKYDLTVYIGRFSPPHVGHEHVIRTAMASSDYLVILIGSVNKPRTIKDPWTYQERREMLISALGKTYRGDAIHSGNILILPLADEPYNDQLWIQHVQHQVQSALDVYGLPKTARIALTGSKRDWTTYYLDYFPTWDKQFLPAHEDPLAQASEVNSTLVRDHMFQDLLTEHRVSSAVFDCIECFRTTEHFTQLKEEYALIQAGKIKYGNGPFLTVDAVVVQSGHILLVKRRASPGKGLWALPGGFLELTETLLNGAIRELYEETGIKVPEKVLRGSLRGDQVFDAPGRSLRGRTVTHAFVFKLSDAAELPDVKGSDDAEKAKWFPISEVEEMEDQMFEDHHAIVKTMIRRI